MSSDNIDEILKKTVKSGDVSLAIPNLIALNAMRTIASNEDIDDTERLILTVWVLENQHSERLLDFRDNPPSRGELAKTAMKIDIENIHHYIACLEEIEKLLGGKK
ncbi:MAG: hypothetical protein B6D57_04815 [Candidatus Coatesbacteria bacterium 4484_99]|uniref:Uncharacterized protein n=1 Tax=Candidatus Coatesbacteria bacterium 4484_99 TaxID=1970774 RepID=A0A1W9RZV3_9BACT|nr:MAG: hypothetical protein B6D57_04815 [Candidatus Coatesbacteria bacterium 4484_99]RLC40650.1 MAG: hypothetical protein DRH51_05015 [Candidatus Coatesbacteria bacterium]RLC42621.1 MAG: hypothetical protein DRH49_03565 [Candidatus Coatesbacteria bacterium]RLC42950.1 MAG: hypothetical protein DRH44_05650 [Candidatus Coatesbacteria bacterium]